MEGTLFSAMGGAEIAAADEGSRLEEEDDAAAKAAGMVPELALDTGLEIARG
jgi:hypothetical protein